MGVIGAEDRWTCPVCLLTVTASHRMDRLVRAASVRMARDLHRCPGPRR